MAELKEPAARLRDSADSIGSDDPPCLSIVIVTHNSEAHIEALLESIPAACGEMTHEVVVVDSASTDGTVARVRERGAEARLLALLDNRGYGSALNAGVAIGRGSHLALANADLLLSPRCLLRLVEAVDADPAIAVAGPLLRNRAGMPTPSAFEFRNLRYALAESFPLNRIWAQNPLRMHEQRRDIWPDRGGPCDKLMGALMVLRREVWNAVGPFDEDYFLYLEEDDWFLRAAKLGFHAYFRADAEAMHAQGASSKNKPGLDLIWTESLFRYWRKHHGRAANAVFWCIQLAGQLLRATLYSILSLLGMGENPAEIATSLRISHRRTRWLVGMRQSDEGR